MIAADAFTTNAYRVLRLTASASAADIQKAAARMRQAAANGSATTSEMDLPQLGEVPRGEADICAAVDRLANPVQRITDRLFWFCQRPTSSGARVSSAMDPSGHDTVLRALINLRICAMHSRLDESDLAARVEVLRAWHDVSRDDDYWFLTLIYEDYGSFEAPATTEELEALRADAVRLASEQVDAGVAHVLAAGRIM